MRTTDHQRDVTTVDELAVGDTLRWMHSLYEVTAIGTDLSDVEGRHVELQLRASEHGRPSMMEEHTIHARLINRWLELDRYEFYQVSGE